MQRLSRFALLLAAAVAGCTQSEAQPKVPLREYGASQPETGAAGALSGKARDALARGNDAFRAARYAAALTDYRAASREAPQSAAPYFGILMAAQKLGDKTLADSASVMIRKLSGEAPDGIHPAGAP
jgi:hypothetical protein